MKVEFPRRIFEKSLNNKRNEKPFTGCRVVTYGQIVGRTERHIWRN